MSVTLFVSPGWQEYIVLHENGHIAANMGYPSVVADESSATNTVDMSTEVSNYDAVSSACGVG